MAESFGVYIKRDKDEKFYTSDICFKLSEIAFMYSAFSDDITSKI